MKDKGFQRLIIKLAALKKLSGMTKEKAKSFFTPQFVDEFWGKV